MKLFISPNIVLIHFLCSLFLLLQSSCSSQERLHQLPFQPTAEDLRLLSQQLSNSDGNVSAEEDGRRSPSFRQRSRSIRYVVVRRQVCVLVWCACITGFFVEECMCASRGVKVYGQNSANLTARVALWLLLHT